MKHVPHSTFATSIQKIHTMKADISITKSRKGTEIVVSGKRINKYGIIAAIVFAVPMLILFQSIHGENNQPSIAGQILHVYIGSCPGKSIPT